MLEKISSQENKIADFISRNHNEDDIAKYFKENDYSAQSKLVVPIEWYRFVAEW